MTAQRRPPNRYFTAFCALLLGLSPPAAAQAVHFIRLEADTAQEVYRFVPARVTARPGDILVFRVVSGAPHNVAFEAAGLTPAAHEALNSALTDRSGDLSGPLLAQNGAQYRLRVPALPPGRYLFFSVSHRAYDMQGELIVTK
jgi:plastocyanin